MAIVLRYVDRMGFVMERFINVVHVQNTSALSLENAIVNILAQYFVSLSYVRGQCYNGVSNMQVTAYLLHGIACLNPINSFSSFDIRKIMRMIELYPDDFDEFSMDALENQLASYIIDVRDIDERFSDLHGLCNLSKRFSSDKKTFKLSFCISLSETYFASASCYCIR
ncbi:uncharacterized protein LOC142179993 [Nicotiana tabacum]|uniref:Uncharacterized protein LOC142179993 n=1 Tax=Nicotiana tabacum TaxID=4097 RepID=A0AC58UC21_TOBAC